jgi:hypothetical protein
MDWIHKEKCLKEQIELIEEKVQPLLKYGLEKDILISEEEDDAVGVIFVLPDEKEIVEEVIEKYFSDIPFTIVVFSIGLKRFIKKFIQQWKERFDSLEIGKEIIVLIGSGIAMYINWSHHYIRLHKYEDGKFLSTQCKKSSSWKTPNGMWIVGFSDESSALNCAEELGDVIKEEFKKEFLIEKHKLCFEGLKI